MESGNPRQFVVCAKPQLFIIDMDTHQRFTNLSVKSVVRLVALQGALFSVTEQDALVAAPPKSSQLSTAWSLSQLQLA